MDQPKRVPRDLADRRNAATRPLAGFERLLGIEPPEETRTLQIVAPYSNFIRVPCAVGDHPGAAVEVIDRSTGR